MKQFEYFQLAPYITLKTSRPRQSAGGQHANKTDSRVILYLDVYKFLGNIRLEEDELNIVIPRMVDKSTSSGYIMVADESSRSQTKNRAGAQQKMVDLINNQIFYTEQERLDTTPSYSSKEKRLKSKKLRSQKKQLRKKPKLD